MKKLNIENYDSFEPLVDRIFGFHQETGGTGSREGLRDLFPKPSTYLFEKEYRGYVVLFNNLNFIETVGVEGDLEDLWFDLGYHVRLLKDENLKPPIDAQMFQDGRPLLLGNLCNTREDLMNFARQSESYDVVKVLPVVAL